MTGKDTGGPAFPWDEKNQDGSHYHSNGGMTLLDWFAGQALTMLADPGCTGDVVSVTRGAYEIADAMLAEKRRREGGAA